MNEPAVNIDDLKEAYKKACRDYADAKVARVEKKILECRAFDAMKMAQAALHTESDWAR